MTVEVDYNHHSTPRRFDTVIRLGADLSDAQLERLHKVAAVCPVRRSIETGIEFAERIEAGRKGPRSARRRLAVSADGFREDSLD